MTQRDVAPGAEPGYKRVRCSSLATLAGCPGLHVVQRGDHGMGSKAAQNGSAVGRVIELAHAGYLLDDALRTATAEAPEKFPLADFDQVARWAFAYCADPRNGPDSPYGPVVPGSCEREVEYVLPAAPGDPDQSPFLLRGHVDQIRRDRSGRLRVWDVKSGRPGGEEMTLQYAWQLAAYALACTATLGEPCLPGGIIRLRGYDRVPYLDPAARDAALAASVHYEVYWSLEECGQMLMTAAAELGRIRAGYVHLRPGLHCMYCPAGPPNGCANRIPDGALEAAPAAAAAVLVFEWGDL